jgi:eukaryotic-like serine/threonine-protein kinase
MELVVHPRYQIPMPAAGTSAVVFKAMAGEEPQALRFFTREDNWSSTRYSALHEHFAATGLAGSVAMPRWVDDAIRVNGRTWPAVRMQWVEGHTLNKHVEDLVRQQDVRALDTLATDWRGLVGRLQRAEFAHGDLQHGNVLVDTRGDMRLVDFDCSWIARFSGETPPGETGHRNYQLNSRPWGRWMDTFSGLIIYTSLLALSKDTNPWFALNTGENLLFRSEDFQPPFHTATWSQLSDLRDRELDELGMRIQECCAPGWSASGGLDELLAPRAKPWWERTFRQSEAEVPLPRSARPEPVAAPRVEQPRPAAPSGQPTQNWWAPAPQPAAKPARPAGRIVGVALGSGLIAAVLTAAVSGGKAHAGGSIGVGVLVIIIALVIGFARRN